MSGILMLGTLKNHIAVFKHDNLTEIDIMNAVNRVPPGRAYYFEKVIRESLGEYPPWPRYSEPVDMG